MIVTAGIPSATAMPDKVVRDAGFSIENDLRLSHYKTASVDLDDETIPEILVYADGLGELRQ